MTIDLIFLIISSLSLVLGACLDSKLGAPYAYHPIVGMGRLIAWGERRLNQPNTANLLLKSYCYNFGLTLMVFTLGMLVEYVLLQGMSASPWAWVKAGLALLLLVLETAGVFYMLSGKTLRDEVRMVFEALDRSLEDGRRQVGRIVGRDTGSLSEAEVQTAALETLSENLSDGVVAPLFWWGLLGLPGMLAYKMVNTQDSMIGYKNERYLLYGRHSARLDDVLNWIPARLTAVLMLMSVWRWDLIPFVQRFARQHSSPNSGYPESALAGILNCRFGGTHDYFGQSVYKPYIGEHERRLSLEDATVAIGINLRVERIMLPLAMAMRIGLLTWLCM